LVMALVECKVERKRERVGGVEEEEIVRKRARRGGE